MKKIISFLLALVLVCVPMLAVAEGENYYMSETVITAGTAQYSLSADFEYTVFAVQPAKTGIYTFSSDDGLIGIVSNNGMWITSPSMGAAELTPDVLSAEPVEWKCTAVEQSIWIAVSSDAAAASITVSVAPLNEKQMEWTVYENKITPVSFLFGGNEDELEYVDVKDDVIDKAVLCSDGLYRLNSIVGPVLYVDFDDDYYIPGGMGNAASETGLVFSTGLKYTIEAGVSGIDYSEAAVAYVRCADTKTGIYYLTEDIIEMYKNGGAEKGWYDEGGRISTKEDAWMFSCCYVPTVHECAAQGELQNDKNTHWYVCLCGEKVGEEAHTAGDWIVKKPATTEAAGEKIKNCVDCGYEMASGEIPVLLPDHSHEAVGGWTSDETGHWKGCACGEKLNSAAHTEGDWTVAKNGDEVKLCTVCGYIIDSRKPAIKLGDVNSSGAIDMMDYILVKRVYFGTFDFTEAQLKLGDVNSSGAIDMMDYILLKRAYFGTFTLE